MQLEVEKEKLSKALDEAEAQLIDRNYHLEIANNIIVQRNNEEITSIRKTFESPGNIDDVSMQTYDNSKPTPSTTISKMLNSQIAKM